MANIYLQTLADCKVAAQSLQNMGSPTTIFVGQDTSITGWILVRLEVNNHNWDDGDWRYTATDSIIDVGGNLWRYHEYQGYEHEREPQRINEQTLTQLTGEDLRQTDVEGGHFRKIRGAIKSLV